MLEYLIAIDHQVFHFMNVVLGNPVTDLVMPAVTSDYLLRPMYGLAVILMLWKGDARLRWLVLVSVVTLTVCDQLASGLLKPLIERSRPCQSELSMSINLLVNCGAGKSMPSAHAANSFGQAILFGFFFRKIMWPLAILASLIAVSRVFVGVHYPADVMAGALLGSLVGLSLAWIYKLLERKYLGHALLPESY